MSDPVKDAGDQPEPEARRGALWRGLAGVIGAIAWLFAISFLNNLLDPKIEYLHAPWRRSLFFGLGLVGVALVVAGLWQLGRARARRNDTVGLVSLLLIFGAVPVLLMWIFLAVLALTPGPIFGN